MKRTLSQMMKRGGVVSSASSKKTATRSFSSFYDFTANQIEDGKEIAMKDICEGKPTLILNVATL